MSSAAGDNLDTLRQSYDSIAEEYARRIYGELQHKPLDRALLDYVAEVLRNRGPVADMGCGPGHVGRYLFDRGLQVVGVDLSPQMVRVAAQLNPGMTFRQGSMLELDMDGASWAGIVAFYSIIHTPPENLPRVFRELNRVLMPGGLLLLAFHEGTKHVHLDDWWGHEVSVDTYFLDRAAVERLLDAEGFTVEAHVERQPDEAVEYPSRRAYVFACKGEQQ